MTGGYFPGVYSGTDEDTLTYNKITFLFLKVNGA